MAMMIEFHQCNVAVEDMAIQEALTLQWSLSREEDAWSPSKCFNAASFAVKRFAPTY